MPFHYQTSAATTETATLATNSFPTWQRWNAEYVTVVRQGNFTQGTTSQVWNNWAVTASASTNSQTITITGEPGDTFQIWVTDGSATTAGTEMHRLRIPGNIIHTQDIQTANVFNGWAGTEAHRGRVHVDPRVQAEVDEAWRQRRREEQAAAEARRRETALAHDRAMALLRSCLNAEQLRELAANNYFFVTAPSGNLYRIDKGSHGNIKRIDPQTGRWVESLCVQPRGVPEGDAMLMQKLLIETAEEELRRVANITLRDGGMDRSSGQLITGERLAEVIPFPRGRREAA